MSRREEVWFNAKFFVSMLAPSSWRAVKPAQTPMTRVTLLTPDS